MNEIATAEAVVSPTPALNGDDSLYEVVHGTRVEMPAMGIYSTLIASLLQRLLGQFVDQHRLGRVATEALLILDVKSDLRRRPDVAFVSTKRWPLEKPIPEEGDWEVVPDLAIEVISPKELFQSVHGKVREYFDAGVRQVWLVIPSERVIHVYQGPTTVQIRRETEDLDGGELLPGFRLSIGTLFQPKTPG